MVCLASKHFSVLDARQSSKIFDDIVAISAIGLGFWSTAATLLLAVEHKSLMRRLKKGPHFRLMIGYVFAAITWLGIILMLTLVGIFLGDRIAVRPKLDRFYAFAWSTAAVVALTATFRAYHILSKILKLAASEEESE
jgi:hypothetical protein